MLELRQAMEDLYDKGVRNFFLDEITEVTDFQKYGNTFSDYLQQKELNRYRWNGLIGNYACAIRYFI